MEKPGSIKTSQKDFLVVMIVFLGMLCLEWIIGIAININTFVFITYLSFLLSIYKIDTRLLLDYYWLVVFSTLNILGNYVCDTQEVYLVELSRTTSYVCSFTPLVIVYVFLISVLEWVRLKTPKGYVIQESENTNTKPRDLFIVLLIGIAIATFLYLRVFSHPFFSIGATRIVYAQEQMNKLDRSLKSYLPIFMPIAIMYWIKTKKAFFPVLFFLLTLAYYFWVGDKFGTYFNAIYIVSMSVNKRLEEKQIKKILIALVSAIGLLMIIVYVYRVLLFHEDKNMFIRYLSQRLAQQGEVWWSVYQNQKGTSIKLNEFTDELKAILPFSKTKEVVGQWKMMLVSSQYSAYAHYRIDTGNPYTTTTTASLYYYFRWPGTILFYGIMGLLYGKLIQNTTEAIRNFRILETMLLIKILISFHNILFASDLYLISYKGLFYIVTLYILRRIRKNREKTRNGYVNEKN